MLDQARAILWAQWRTLINFYPRGHLGSLAFTVVMSAVWYGMWVAGSAAISIFLADPAQARLLPRVLPFGLFLAFLYWQLIPLMLVSAGASLDLRRLLVYPVAPSHLFALEVMLRISTGIEMILVLAGATVGLLRNPAVPLWGPLAFLPFVLMNLFLAAGLRDLLARLLARKRIRELLVLLMVLAIAAPQVLLLTGAAQRLRGIVDAIDVRTDLFQSWPWAAAGAIAHGEISWRAFAVLAFWTLAAWRFGRWQFTRSLRFDADAARATERKSARGAAWIEALYRLPSRLLPDPLGAMVEKEIRFLSRAPRFRLVFFMGFTFGLLVWLPLALRTRGTGSAFSGNYLTAISVYALLLLGEVTFWNTFGFDRTAAQLYYLIPVRFSTIIVGKNLAATFFVLLEVTAVAVVCAAVGMPVTAAKTFESFLVTLILTIYLLAVGNLGSTHYPRAVNPAQSWRTASAGRFQALLLLLYPVVSIPILLAYGARFAFQNEAAFYLALAFAASLGGVVYWVAMDSSLSAAEERKEKLLEALAQGQGPIST
jgi:ABC-2 type transport system permease protein